MLVVIGIDEVGRGCLAGPVVAAAVAFPTNHQPIVGVDDSKRLSAKRREALDCLIRQDALYTGIGQVEAEEIDAIGIVAATGKAMRSACHTFSNPYHIFVDGPHTLGLERLAKTTPIVHGDRLKYEISAASIVAKVFRDRLMNTLSGLYPMYGWDKNVGYGTRQHRLAISQYGLTCYHRKTFIH